MAMSRHVLAYKLRAFLLALFVFSVFAIGLALLAWQVWYPGFLFTLDGGLQGLRIVLAVDFVLGPLLALVFFHPEKARRKLVFDIVVVSALQVAAMGWGAWQVWSQRPVAVVYGNQRFISVAPDIMQRQQQTPATLARYSPDSPPFVYRREPRDRRESQRLMVMLVRYGFHAESQAWLFEPFVPNRQNVFVRQAALQAFVRTQLAAPWAGFAARRAQQDPADYRLAFYEGRFGDAVLVFSRDGALLGHLPLGSLPIPDLAAPATVSR